MFSGSPVSVRLCVLCVSVVDVVQPRRTLHTVRVHASPTWARRHGSCCTQPDRARGASRPPTRPLARIAALDATLSDYRADSELSRLTREAVGRPVPVSARSVPRARGRRSDWRRARGGAFDITVGPLSQLWRRARRQIELPSPADLAAARAVTGYTPPDAGSRARRRRLSREAGHAARRRRDRQGLRRRRSAAACCVHGACTAHWSPWAATSPWARRRRTRAGWQVALAGLDPDRAAPGSPLARARRRRLHVGRCGAVGRDRRPALLPHRRSRRQASG